MTKKINRFFGIEVEVSTEYNKVKQIIEDLDILTKRDINFIEHYGKSNGKKFELKIDSSTETEFVTPKLKMDSPKYILFKEILNEFKRNNIKVTKQDGLHVHIECKDINKNAIKIAWILIENDIKKLFPINRRNGTYTNSIISTRSHIRCFDIFNNDNDNFDNHHSALNMEHFDDRKTIEFRLHEGTIDFKEINNYVNFCLCFVEYCSTMDITNFIELLSIKPNQKIKYTPNNIQDILNIKSTKIINWINSRYERFN